MQYLAVLLLAAIGTALHTFGIFLAAKIAKIEIEEWALGIGPHIFRSRVLGVPFVVRLIQIGGYVKMNEDSYGKVGWYTKVIVSLSGCLLMVCLGSVMMMRFDSIPHVFDRFIEIVCSPSDVGVLSLRIFYEMVQTSAVYMFGFGFIYMSIINLIPINITNGGAILQLIFPSLKVGYASISYAIVSIIIALIFVAIHGFIIFNA